MKSIKRIAAVTAAALCLTAAAGCSSEQGFMGNTEEASLEEGDVFAVISIMDYGDITVKLYPEGAPDAVKHFIKLAEDKSYDGRTIHRVVKDKLIQGGSLTGTGFDGNVARQEYFATETHKYMCHYYGALCMAKSKEGNYRQFYIVNNNTPVNIDELADKIESQLADEEIGGKMLETDKEYYKDYSNKLSNMPEEVKERYAQVGGLYDLDGEDTVFGQVVSGYDILKKINEVETVNGNNSDDKQGIASKPIDEIVIEKIEVIRIAPAETTVSEKGKVTRPSSKTEATDPGYEIIVDGSVPVTVSPDETEVEPETEETTGEESDTAA